MKAHRTPRDAAVRPVLRPWARHRRGAMLLLAALLGPGATLAGPPAAPAATDAPPRPRIAPDIDDGQRAAARAQGRALRAAAAASAATARMLKGPAFAIVTPATPHRDAALSQLALLRALVARMPTEVPTQLDLMPIGRQWRVVWWPHTTREAADRLLAEVGARGLKAELLAF